MINLEALIDVKAHLHHADIHASDFSFILRGFVQESVSYIIHPVFRLLFRPTKNAPFEEFTNCISVWMHLHRVSSLSAISWICLFNLSLKHISYNCSFLRFDKIQCVSSALYPTKRTSQTPGSPHMHRPFHSLLAQPFRHAGKRPNSQIPDYCTCCVSHNAPFRTEMCTFLFWMEHWEIWNGCILGFVKLVYCTVGLRKQTVCVLLRIVAGHLSPECIAFEECPNLYMAQPIIQPITRPIGGHFAWIPHWHWVLLPPGNDCETV